MSFKRVKILSGKANFSLAISRILSLSNKNIYLLVFASASNLYFMMLTQKDKFLKTKLPRCYVVGPSIQ